MNKSVVLLAIVSCLVLSAILPFTQADNAEDANCTLCKETVKEAEKKLEPVANKTDAVVEDALLDSCKIFGPLKFECFKLIEEENEKLIQGVKNDVAPAQLCADVGKCPKTFY
jgi:hypothetical protein